MNKKDLHWPWEKTARFVGTEVWVEDALAALAPIPRREAKEPDPLTPSERPTCSQGFGGTNQVHGAS